MQEEQAHQRHSALQEKVIRTQQLEDRKRRDEIEKQNKLEEEKRLLDRLKAEMQLEREQTARTKAAHVAKYRAAKERFAEAERLKKQKA